MADLFGELLNLPEADLKLRREGETVKVFDSLRRKYVAFTPEENVRQHFVAWLTGALHYPASLCANEIEINLNGLRRRPDTVVFGNDMRPLMIVEYKAPDVAITQDVFDQIARYNMVLKAKYLVVSNGLKHYCCVLDHVRGEYHFIPHIPEYQELLTGSSCN